MDSTKGVIYILTNPSFPEYVKIGYADDIEKRLKDLNRSECVPFAFRLYAYYKVENRLSDKRLHELIDGLNPNLRSIENLDGKERKREFYAMPKEQAYSILKSIASMNNLEKNLILVNPTEEQLCDEQEAAEIENMDLTLEQFYVNKNENLIKLHEKLFAEFKKVHEEVYEKVTPNYIAIRNGKGRNVCEVHIYKSKILIITREPRNKDLLIGERVPKEYLWSLNYRVYFNSEKEIGEVVEVLNDVYNQIKEQ